MGVLEHLYTGDRVPLRARHLVGRSRRSDLRLADPEVSGQHAALTWNGREWRIRDLGSRNGTWVNGRRLAADERMQLRQDDTLAFGGPEAAWTVKSASGPSPLALSGDEWRDGETGMLALPDAQTAELLVFADPSRGWVARTDDGDRIVLPGDEVEAGGRTWRLDLPVPLAPTLEVGPIRATLDEIGLRFALGPDDDLEQLTLVMGDSETSLPPHGHHALLLALARARLVDAAMGDGTDEHGWLRHEDLQKMLGLSRNQLQLRMHRARRELEALDVAETVALFQHRPGSDHVRLGVADLQIRKL